MKNSNYYAILMAGGVGSRFWPVSTQDFPKQFHDMLGTGDTLIQKTFQRLSHLIPKENILILTTDRYNDLVLEQLPEIKQEQVVLDHLLKNKTNKDIAEALFLSVSTVKSHTNNIYKKLNVQSRDDAKSLFIK